MIYLLAILWFASGFAIMVHHTIYEEGRDFDLFSDEFGSAIFCGILAPLLWLGWMYDMTVLLLKKAPKITLFKARNK